MTDLSYDEAVHTYIGATLITVAALGAWFVDRPDSPPWRHHLWLALGLFLGWIVMGSNESWTPPTEGNVWWTPIEHLLTMSGPKSWWTALTSPHVLQHKLSALCIMTPAITEWFIRRRPAHPASRYLRWIAPAALLGVAVIFTIHRPVHRHTHGAAMDPAAMQSELYQHYVFAAAFLAAAVSVFLARLPATAARVPPRAWYAFMALGGLVFVTFRV
ncbi:MAG TPA: hypothetical protein VGQ06_16110 [Gemmatimonadales bacterium]|jgi:hypothetical protein|nr:hypothetical protein [Gemmatimonadales bacterium]